MLIIKKTAYARAGLIGNPSDGYGGKTISVIVKNFHAQVVLYEWPKLEVLPSQNDQGSFDSIDDLARDVRLHGYYGGIRLVKATIKRFLEYCKQTRHPLHDRNFSIRYESNIPRQVGLAGSSAIIVATLRALMEFYEVDIPERVQPSLVLSVERGELGIAAGLQDRVIQIYEGAVHMDFGNGAMDVIDGLDCGTYARIDPEQLPPLYVAYSEEVGEPTEVTHAPLRVRYDRGDADVLAAMDRFAELTDLARDAITSGDGPRLSALLDENFDLRQSIMDLNPAHVRMVETARKQGASGKFAGSGGAIVGVLPEGCDFDAFRTAFAKIGCDVIRPQIV